MLFRSEDEAFSPLLRALFGRGAACPALPGVCLPCAPDIETECRAAAGEILQRMEGGARWRDITVACADPETYRPVLETVLRRAGYPSPYEALKALTRTNTHITAEAIAAFIAGLDVSEEVKAELRAITPASYTGIDF